MCVCVRPCVHASYRACDGGGPSRGCVLHITPHSLHVCFCEFVYVRVSKCVCVCV